MDCMASLLVNDDYYAENYDFCKENKDYFEVNVDYYADSDDLDILVAGLKGAVYVLVMMTLINNDNQFIILLSIIQSSLMSVCLSV